MKKIRYCGNCGELLEEGAQYCGACGAPVTADLEKTAQDPQGSYYGQNSGNFRMDEADMQDRFNDYGEGASGNEYPDDTGQDYPFVRFPDEEHHENRNRDKLILIIVGVVLAILVVILVLLIYRRMSPSAGEPNDPKKAGSSTTITQSQDDNADETIDSEDADEAQDKSDSGMEAISGEDTADDSNENTSGSNATDTDESESDSTVTGNDNSREETDTKDKDVEKKSETQDSGYILPDSAGRFYSRSEIEALTDTELLYALNEIYARHGRVFKDEQIREYFESQSWYHGTVSGESFDPIQDQVFNSYEKQNRDLIVDVMEERGMR